MTTIRDEAVGRRQSARQPRWGVWRHQFDLIRAVDGVRYLRRWWLIKTPYGGVALHRMDGPDARDVLHDHPFSFVSLVLRGGYFEERLDPLTMTVRSRRIRRVNRMRKFDAHTIWALTRIPTWTLLFIGPNRRTWGFWEPGLAMPVWVDDGEGGTRPSGRTAAAWGEWRWTKHDSFDSGHYVP